MISVCPIKNGVIGLVFLAIAPFLFASPVEVETLSDDVPYRPPIEEDPGDNYGTFEMQHQMQLLQQEVQELRGMVEELTYQLERMSSTQEDRYLELDSRIQGLQQQIDQGGGGPRDMSGLDQDIADIETSPVVAGSGSERDLYETALDLIRGRQYDRAIDQLQALVARYPDGDFTANAYYWLGEVYAAKPEPDYEQARQALAQVITFFPDHRKVPDAAFKLGKVYDLMGNCARSKELLQQVMNDHPGTSVATLAETYLRDNIDC